MAAKQVDDLFLKIVESKHEDGDDDHDHDDDKSALLVAKATAMVVLFLATLLLGTLPFQLSKWFKWFDKDNANTKSGTRTSLVISLLLCFGGGVLLATTFLHLLPEISENIAMLQSQGQLPHFEFHFAEALMCIGFFTMYFVEEIVHLFLRRQEHELDSRKSSTSSGAEDAFRRGKSVRDSTLLKNKQKPEASLEASTNDLDVRNGSLSTADLIKNDVENMKVTGEGNKSATPSDNYKRIHKSMNAGHAHMHGHTHMPKMEDDIIVSSLRGLLIVLALSVHELFEGLAVGLESSPGKVWYMFGAVSAHKLVLAFCVGVELLVTRTKTCLAITYIMTFAAVSPIGIGIGILISGSNTNGDLGSSNVPAVILQGLASGTLLYVVFFEILSKDRSGMAQYTAVLVGFCVMFGLQFLSEFSFH